jgi:hypothetical protein
LLLDCEFLPGRQLDVCGGAEGRGSLNLLAMALHHKSRIVTTQSL